MVLVLATSRNKDQLFLWLPSHCRSNGTIVSRCQTHTRCDCSKEFENPHRLCLDHCAGWLRWKESKQRQRCQRSAYLVARACYSEILTCLRHKDQQTQPATIHCSTATMRSLFRAHRRCGCSKESENPLRLCLDHCAGSVRWKESKQRQRYRRSACLVERAYYSETQFVLVVSVPVSASVLALVHCWAPR